MHVLLLKNHHVIFFKATCASFSKWLGGNDRKTTAESVRRHSVNHNPSGVENNLFLCRRVFQVYLRRGFVSHGMKENVHSLGRALTSTSRFVSSQAPGQRLPSYPTDSASKPLGKYRDLGLLAGQIKST